MDTVSYGFSACSDGGVSYNITCVGPDCSLLGDLFGSICSGDGSTVTCKYSNCNGSVDYTSTSQISASNSTFYATNNLSINDCADVSFTVNGTDVLPLATSSNPQCSAASSILATAGSSSSTASSLSAPSGVLSSLSTERTTSSPSSWPTTLIQPTTPGSVATNSAATAPSSSCSKYEPTTPPLSRVSSSIAAGSSTAAASPVPPSQASLTSSSGNTKPAVSTSNTIEISFSVTSPSNGSQATSSSPNSALSLIQSGLSSMTGSSSMQRFTSTAEVVGTTQQSGVAYSTTTTAVLTPVGKTTLPPSSSSSSTTSATAKVQQSKAVSRRGSSRVHANFTTILPFLMLILALWTPTVAALGGYPDHASSRPRLLVEPGKAVSPAAFDHKALMATRGLVPTINDVSTWYTQFTGFLSNSQPDLSSAFTTLETDMLEYACQVFLSYVETDINRQLLFKQEWQQCVAQGETWVQKLQQAVYPNGTNPLGNGLPGHYLTVAFNLAAGTGVKAGCDFLFSKLLQQELGLDPAEQTCDAWLASLGLSQLSPGATPTTTTSAPSASQTSSPLPPSSFKLIIEGTHTSTDGQYVETGGRDLNGIGFDFGAAEAVFSIDSNSGYLYVTNSPNLIVMAYIVTIGWCVSSSVKNIAPTYIRDSEATTMEQLLAGGFAPLVCSVNSGKLQCTATNPCPGFPGTWNTWLLDSFGLYIATGPSSDYPQPNLVIQT